MNLRDEAILMLDKRGRILEVAATVCAILRDHGIEGAVVGLIQRHKLTGEFAATLPRSLRPESRKLAKAVAEEG